MSKPKSADVVRMATPTRLILVTADTFDTLTYHCSQSFYLLYRILLRGASVADAAILVALQQFQMQFTLPPNSSNYCAVFVTFPRTRNADIYNVGSLSRSANVKNSKHTEACRCLRNWASKSSRVGEEDRPTISFDKRGQQ